MKFFKNVFHFIQWVRYHCRTGKRHIIYFVLNLSLTLLILFLHHLCRVQANNGKKRIWFFFRFSFEPCRGKKHLTHLLGNYYTGRALDFTKWGRQQFKHLTSFRKGYCQERLLWLQREFRQIQTARWYFWTAG